MNARALCACFILTMGPQLWSYGQLISRRYDVGDQYRPESGFGIELTAGGYLILAGSQFADDSTFYSSIVTILKVGLNGVPFDTARAIISPLAATYPGHANVGFVNHQGGSKNLLRS